MSFITPKWQYDRNATGRARKAQATLQHAYDHVMSHREEPIPFYTAPQDEDALSLLKAAMNRVWAAHDEAQKIKAL